MSGNFWFIFFCGVFALIIISFVPPNDILENQSWKFKTELYEGHQYNF